jgi:hypothetical protein
VKEEPAPRIGTDPVDDARDAAGGRRLQILSTEHWSLLATRTMTWNEIFARTGSFLTVLSASVVALSLAAQASKFGRAFDAFALLLLPVVLLVGVATYLRLVEADIEDAWLVIGMNRIRHAYLEISPDLEPYFVTAHHDDGPGLLQTYSFGRPVGVSHWVSGSPVLVALIDVIVTGGIAGVSCRTAGVSIGLQLAVGAVAGLGAGAVLGFVGYRRVRRVRSAYRPRFPSMG